MHVQCILARKATNNDRKRKDLERTIWPEDIEEKI